MKRLLTFLALCCLMVTGAWAERYHIYQNNGTLHTTGSSTFCSQWTSTQTDPQISINVTDGNGAANDMQNNSTYADGGIVCYTGDDRDKQGYKATLTVAASHGYNITGYEFDASSLTDGCTISVSDGTTTKTLTGTTAQTISKTGVNAQNFVITIQCTAGSNRNTAVLFNNFYVTYEAAEPIENEYKVVFETPSSGTPYRIPAVGQAQNGDLIFVSDYRYSKADIGMATNGKLDLKMRKKKANGTWENEKVLQACIESPTFTAFGDPCIVVDNTPGNPGKVMVTSCCGNVSYPNGSHSNHQGWARWYSTDNGDTWSSYTDISQQVVNQVDQRTGAKLAAFFIGSGKISQSKTIKVNNYNRLYCASLTTVSPDGANANKTTMNYVWYSDDFGENWHMLGTPDGNPINGGNEPKAEELPDGSVLISSRTSGGRIYNIWHYTDTEAGKGYWGTQQKCTDTYGADCNGEILVVPVTRASNSEKTYLLLQSIPADANRNYVSIYWKELTDLTKYRTAAELSNGGWTKFPVSTTTSAYSTMCQMQDGHIAFYYEENSHNDGYDMVYKNFSVEEITGNAYSYSTLNATEKATYLTNGVGTYFDGESPEVQALAATYKTTPNTENYDALNAALQNPDDLFFTPGLYQIQVASGSAQNHATYKDYYLFDNRSNNSTWPIGLTPDASVESTYVYIWGSHDNWHMEFNHGKDNSYYVGTDSKVATSAGNLSFIPNADKTEWKIWGGNTNRWIGWNLNGPAIGVSSKNEEPINNCYFIFTKVEEELPTPALSLETESTVTSSQLSELSITFTGANAAQVQLSETKNKAYLTPKASTPAQVKAQNGKLKAAGETPAAIEGNITKDANTDGKFNIAFEDEIPAGDYELSIPEGTFLVGTTPVPVLKANYKVAEEPASLVSYGLGDKITSFDDIVSGECYAIVRHDGAGYATLNTENHTVSGSTTYPADGTAAFIFTGNNTDGYTIKSAVEDRYFPVLTRNGSAGTPVSLVETGDNFILEDYDNNFSNGIQLCSKGSDYHGSKVYLYSGSTTSNFVGWEYNKSNTQMDIYKVIISDIPVNGKVYTIYNDHRGAKWYVSKVLKDNCQAITTSEETEDGLYEWIAWGSEAAGYTFYNRNDNSVVLKANSGVTLFAIDTTHELCGVTLCNKNTAAQHMAGNRTTGTLNGGVFSTNNADWYNNEFQNTNGYWSTDFVFNFTGEYAYKIEGPSGAQVKIGENTYSAGQFYVTKTALTQNDIHDIVPYTASLSGNVITLEPVLKEGRVCTVKAHFNEGNAPDRYLVNNADQLTFKNVGDAATTPDKTYYWVVRATGNSTYPWSLQSYDSKYLDGNSETGALSETGLPMYIEKSSVEGCFHMKAYLATGTRWLGTWKSGHDEGFGEWNNCFGQSDSYAAWTTHYEIEPVDGVKAYIVNGVGSGSCKLKNAIDGYYEANYSFKAGDVLVVPTTTELTESDLTLDEGYTVYIEDNVITIDKIVTFTLEISTPVGYNGTAPTVTYNNESRENGYSFTAGAISVKPSQFTGNTIEGAIDYNYASAADLANAKYLEGKTYDYVKAKPCVSIVKVDEDNYTVLVDYKLYHPLWRLEKAQEGKEDNPKNKFEEVVQTSTQTGRPVMIYDASLQDIYNTGVTQDWTGFMYVDANDNLRKTNATFPLIFAGGLECVWKIIKDEEATDEKYFLRNEANKMYYDGKGNKYTEENRAGHSVYLQVFPESTTTKASASAHCMNFYDEYIGDISSDTGVWTIGNVKTGNGGNWNGQVAEFVGNYSHSSAFSFYDLCDLKNVINAESDSIKDVCLDYAAYFDGINEYSHNYGTFGKRYDDAKELHSHNSGSTSTFTNYVNIVLDETVGEIFAPKAGRLLNIQNSATLNYMKGANLSEEKTVMWLNDDDQLVSWDTGLGFAPEAVTAATATTFGNKSFQNVDRASETGDPAEGFVSPVNGTMVISFNGFNYYNDARNGKAGTSTVKAGDKATTTWWIDDAVELPMTLSPDGYTSFYAPAPTQLPEGLNAYVAATCTEAEEIKDGIRATITMQNIGQTIPAKTPVIIKGTAGSAKATVLYKTETKPDDVTYWVPDYAEVAAIPGDNLLQAFDFTCQNPQYNNGSYTDANDGNKTKYIYTLTSNGNFMYYVGKELRGFRCFLVLDKDYSGLHSGSSSAPLRVIFKDDPIVNGISTVSNTTYSKGTFDLSGRRVQNTERGLYIVNGKKVIR